MEENRKKTREEKMGKQVLLYALTAVGFITEGFFIASSCFENAVRTAILKTIASIIFVLIGLAGYRRLKKSLDKNPGAKSVFSKATGRQICTGLFLWMLGDIFLTLRFVFTSVSQPIFFIGILCFLSGHIFYLIATVPRCTHIVISAVSALLIAVSIVLIYVRILEVTLLFKIAGIIYVGVIAFLTTSAFSNLLSNPCPPVILFAAGAFFFSTSDILLMLVAFGSVKNLVFAGITLALYYLGQMLIAHSVNQSAKESD